MRASSAMPTSAGHRTLEASILAFAPAAKDLSMTLQQVSQSTRTKAQPALQRVPGRASARRLATAVGVAADLLAEAKAQGRGQGMRGVDIWLCWRG